jgi:hypothetical protein
MIIPTAEYDPLFADDGIPFRTKMIQYIEREFSDLLGSRRGLLYTDGGLDALSGTGEILPRPADRGLRKAA